MLHGRAGDVMGMGQRGRQCKSKNVNVVITFGDYVGLADLADRWLHQYVGTDNAM